MAKFITIFPGKLRSSENTTYVNSRITSDNIDILKPIVVKMLKDAGVVLIS